MALHKVPRYTKDLNIWINNDKESAFKLENALREFGFETNASEEFLIEKKMIILGKEPNRIDILNTPKGVYFEECYLKSLTTFLGEYEIRYLSKECLIQNKRAVGRPQDLVDIESLLSIT